MAYVSFFAAEWKHFWITDVNPHIQKLKAHHFVITLSLCIRQSCQQVRIWQPAGNENLFFSKHFSLCLCQKQISSVDSMHIQWNYGLIHMSELMELSVENFAKDGSSTRILFTREWSSIQDQNQKQIQWQPTSQSNKHKQATSEIHILHLYKHNKIKLNKSISIKRIYKHFIIKRLLTIKWHHIEHFNILIKDVYRDITSQSKKQPQYNISNVNTGQCRRAVRLTEDVKYVPIMAKGCSNVCCVKYKKFVLTETNTTEIQPNMTLWYNRDGTSLFWRFCPFFCTRDHSV